MRLQSGCGPGLPDFGAEGPSPKLPAVGVGGLPLRIWAEGPRFSLAVDQWPFSVLPSGASPQGSSQLGRWLSSE